MINWILSNNRQIVSIGLTLCSLESLAGVIGVEGRVVEGRRVVEGGRNHLPFPFTGAQQISERVTFSIRPPALYWSTVSPSSETEQTLARYQPGFSSEGYSFHSAYT